MNVNNVPLANIIASFNSENSFDNNIVSLKREKLQLEKQLMIVNEKLKKYD